MGSSIRRVTICGKVSAPTTRTAATATLQRDRNLNAAISLLLAVEKKWPQHEISTSSTTSHTATA